MRNIKKFLMLAMTIIPLFSSMTVNASTVSVTAKQNADYMMSTDKDGTPNWFNGVCYSNSYEDLKIAYGNNEKALYHHCLEYGFQEGRLVSPILDVAKYKKAYPDLEKAFGNNWELYVRHYFEYGIAEGRENFTGFDAQTYLNIYPDTILNMVYLKAESTTGQDRQQMTTTLQKTVTILTVIPQMIIPLMIHSPVKKELIMMDIIH